MTGGLAYVLDAPRARVNQQLVAVEALDEADEACVRGWLEQHAALTGSARARAILAAWPEYAPRFSRIAPKDAAIPDRPIPVTMPARSAQPSLVASPAAIKSAASGD
jgi:glutamate synthase domain-containing protein 3